MNLRRFFPLLLLLAALPAAADRSKPLPVTVLSGTPEEMGRAHGTLLRKEIQTVHRKYLHAGLYKRLQFSRKDAEARARHYERHIPLRYLSEMKALAEAAGAFYLDVLVANTLYEVVKGPTAQELAEAAEAKVFAIPRFPGLAFACSSFAAATERGLLVGRNLDWANLNVAHCVGRVFVLKPEGKRAILSVGWPGTVGVITGMNDAGLTLTLNTFVGTKDTAGVVPETPPAMFEMRRALEEAAVLDEMREKLLERPRATGQILLLSEGSTERAEVLEMMGRKHAVIPMENGFVAATNFSRTLFEQPLGPGTERLETLETRCAAKPVLSIQEAQEALDAVSLFQDRYGSATLHSVVFEPRTLTAHVAVGKLPATKGAFRKIVLSDYLP